MTKKPFNYLKKKNTLRMGRQRREMVFLYSGCLCGIDRTTRRRTCEKLLESIKTQTNKGRQPTGYNL